MGDLLSQTYNITQYKPASPGSTNLTNLGFIQSYIVHGTTKKNDEEVTYLKKVTKPDVYKNFVENENIKM